MTRVPTIKRQERLTIALPANRSFLTHEDHHAH